MLATLSSEHSVNSKLNINHYKILECLTLSNPSYCDSTGQESSYLCNCEND